MELFFWNGLVGSKIICITKKIKVKKKKLTWVFREYLEITFYNLMGMLANDS